MQILGNKSIYKLLFLILILFTFTFTYADDETESFSYTPEAKALISDREIVAGHIIQFKIRATGDKITFPKIEKIDGVKVLEQNERITNKFHYINGKLKKERTTLVMTLAPYQDITIPSYDVEIDGRVYKTKPIKIKVAKANAQNKEDNNKFLLHLRADKKSAIVGEPILATVYFSLKFGVKLTKDPQYNKPAFKGFFAKEVGDKKVYNEDHRQITEFKYLLTPLYDGHFTVGPATAKMGVPDRNRRDMFGRSIGTTWVPIASNTINIEVKKKPQESDLVGSFTIENSLDTKSVKANKPVNLTVKIAGEGTLEDFEFPDFEIDGVTVYSDDASITTDLSNNTVHSSYSKSFAFISDHDFTIPARRISAYDTKSKTLKYLEVPSYDIHVEGSWAPAVQKPQAKIQTNLKISPKSMLDIEEENDFSEVQPASWWMIVLSFVSGMLVISFLGMLQKMKRSKKHYSHKESESLKILYPHINESQEIEAMVRKLYAKKNGDKSIVIDKKVLQEMLKKIKN